MTIYNRVGHWVASGNLRAIKLEGVAAERGLGSKIRRKLNASVEIFIHFEVNFYQIIYRLGFKLK